MAIDLRMLLLAACLAGSSLATEPSGITRCQAGAADILGSRKAFAVQVCNLFGATCYMNHPAINSSNCATEALSIPTGTCKVYPIFEYEDVKVRSGDAAVEDLSTAADLGCSVSNSNSDYYYSGACVSVQCDLGSGSFAGPGMTGTGSSRTEGVTDTAASGAFTANTLASISNKAKNLKTVFLYRTGSYVATYKKASSGSSNSISYTVGDLPTQSVNGGWNYGPVACPSAGNPLTSDTATAITAENLRMCGTVTGYVYFMAINLLKDADLYAKFSAGSSNANIGSVAFLDGDENYKSGTDMPEARTVTLHTTDSASSAVLMTSATITPDKTGAASGTGKKVGEGRSYGVVFYCDDYARTDLTACAEANWKMFYVADLNPNAVFGASSCDIGGGSNCNNNNNNGDGATTTTPSTTKKAEASSATGATISMAIMLIFGSIALRL